VDPWRAARHCTRREPPSQPTRQRHAGKICRDGGGRGAKRLISASFTVAPTLRGGNAMDPVAPLPTSPAAPARIALRGGAHEDSPGAFWSQPEPATQTPLTFRDLLAVINPLQHLPVVGSLYRELTGDVPHPAARVLGGVIYGGPFGLFSAAINAMVEQATGRDLAQTAVALVRGGGTLEPLPDESPAATLAAAEPAAGTPTPAPAADAAGAEPAAPPPAAPPLRRAAPAGTRDLAFYQAMAGARLPPSGATTAPQNGGVPMLRPPLVVAAASPAPSPSDGGEHAFTESMRRGLDLYRQMKRTDPPGRSLDRVE
jgi:hypothetical protein